jgi:hypothetical protein
MEKPNLSQLKELLAALLHDCIERKIGEHDMMRCKMCGAEGWNEVIGDPYGVKHKPDCSFIGAYEAMPALLAEREALRAQRALVAKWRKAAAQGISIGFEHSTEVILLEAHADELEIALAEVPGE